VQYSVASIFALPYADGAADGVVSIFAPIAEAEFLRVLRPGGIVVVVGAGPRHLLQLKEALYDTTYLNEERADLPALPELVRRKVCYDLPLRGGETIGQLFSMTPYYWRTSPGDRERLNGVEELTVTVDVDLMVFRKPL
jgi:23S rRNA (guanine745-N1)-methyltransferase